MHWINNEKSQALNKETSADLYVKENKTNFGAEHAVAAGIERKILPGEGKT